MFFVKKIVGKDVTVKRIVGEDTDPKDFVGMLFITERNYLPLCLFSFVLGILVSSLFFNI